MKKFNHPVFMFILIGITLAFVFALSTHAQVIRKGNQFIEQKSDSSKSGATKTEFTYTDSKGAVDTIYLSKNGSAFVYRISKKTGKQYRKYLPEVTKQLQSKKK